MCQKLSLFPGSVFPSAPPAVIWQAKSVQVVRSLLQTAVPLWMCISPAILSAVSLPRFKRWKKPCKNDCGFWFDSARRGWVRKLPKTYGVVRISAWHDSLWFSCLQSAVYGNSAQVSMSRTRSRFHGAQSHRWIYSQHKVCFSTVFNYLLKCMQLIFDPFY